MSAASVQRVREVFQSGDHFTFTVVRHPLDRILSAYRDRIMNGCTSQSKYNVPAVFVELRDSREQYYKTFFALSDTAQIRGWDSIQKAFCILQITSSAPDKFDLICFKGATADFTSKYSLINLINYGKKVL